MAIYQPYALYPVNVDIDATKTNIFKFKLNGNQITAYKLIILKNSDNTVVYDGQIVNISSSPLFNGEELTVTVLNTSGMTNGSDKNYKMKLRVWEYYSTTPLVYIDSAESYFQCRKTPTTEITNYLTEITTRDYTFTGSYSSEQSVGIKYHTYNLYDSNKKLLKTSGKVYNSRLSFYVDGLMSGQTYYIQQLIENQNGIIIDTGLLPIYVTYANPSTLYNFPLNVRHDLDAIQIDLNNFCAILGAATNSDYEYMSHNIYPDDTQIHLAAGNTIEYNKSNINIPSTFVGFYSFRLPVGFVGNIIRLSNTENLDSYTLSYNGENFKLQINDYVKYLVALDATQEGVWWKIALYSDRAILTKIVYNVIFPSETLYPTDTLYPKFLREGL